ncbi:uncharacterized protein LOC134531457 isoform X3 [Bacillus rossius redtenbacheri]|uniref:uncharacterized protein LOC134531457 isoform X3 n=1 Tax=Bacillus rossius redtenbacheri TaxID=93214 RepID=UPI002FDDABCC
MEEKTETSRTSVDTAQEQEGQFDWDELTQSVVTNAATYGSLLTVLLGARLVELWSPKKLLVYSCFFYTALHMAVPAFARWSVYALVASRVAYGFILLVGGHRAHGSLVPSGRAPATQQHHELSGEPGLHSVHESLRVPHQRVRLGAGVLPVRRPAPRHQPAVRLPRLRHPAGAPAHLRGREELPRPLHKQGAQDVAAPPVAPDDQMQTTVGAHLSRGRHHLDQVHIHHRASDLPQEDATLQHSEHRVRHVRHPRDRLVRRAVLRRDLPLDPEEALPQPAHHLQDIQRHSDAGPGGDPGGGRPGGLRRPADRGAADAAPRRRRRLHGGQRAQLHGPGPQLRAHAVRLHQHRRRSRGHRLAHLRRRAHQQPGNTDGVEQDLLRVSGRLSAPLRHFLRVRFDGRAAVEQAREPGWTPRQLQATISERHIPSNKLQASSSEQQVGRASRPRLRPPPLGQRVRRVHTSRTQNQFAEFASRWLDNEALI